MTRIAIPFGESVSWKESGYDCLLTSMVYRSHDTGDHVAEHVGHLSVRLVQRLGLSAQPA